MRRPQPLFPKLTERLLRLQLERSRELLPGVTGEDRSPRIVDLVNENMRLWGPWPELGADPVLHDWTVGWKMAPWKEALPDPRLAFRNCLLLKQQGLLDRIRPCARPGCDEWLFAKFAHANFHRDKCRVAVLSSDEQRKEARKKYMRDLRAKKKVKKFRCHYDGPLHQERGCRGSSRSGQNQRFV